MYYRVAIQGDPSLPWQWKSTVLSELSALFQWLRLYRALPHDCLQIISCSSREGMDEQLVRENQGLGSTSVTAAQFLEEQHVSICSRYARKEIAIMSFAEPNMSGTSAYALDTRNIRVQESWREELEQGSGGDHDLPYTFALQATWPQMLAWIKLLAKVHTGELQP